MARQTSPALAATDRHSEIAVAKAQAVADVPQAGVEAVARTRAYAMQQTALVSNMQQQLSMSALAASGDLDYIKTVTVMGNDSRRHRHHTTRRAAAMSTVAIICVILLVSIIGLSVSWLMVRLSRPS